MNIAEKKNILRKEVFRLNSIYSPDWRINASHEILSELENQDAFKSTSTILLYHAFPDEIQTTAFIDKWYEKKLFYYRMLQATACCFVFTIQN